MYINQNIEQSQKKINEIKNNYISEKQNFLQNYSQFEILNKKLHQKYLEQEKNLIQFKLKSKTLKNNEIEENDINVKLIDTKQIQFDIEKQFKMLGDFGNIFNNCSF